VARELFFTPGFEDLRSDDPGGPEGRLRLERRRESPPGQIGVRTEGRTAFRTCPIQPQVIRSFLTAGNRYFDN
jgi:hypothetical protein